MNRLADILFSAAGLLIMAPVMLILALAVRFGSPGPVFYRQTRVGRGARPFGLLKFRSMVANADQIGSYATVEGDPRITWVGRFLRRSSLDELPQLLNVLKGEMSLVGPRPDVSAQRDEYRPEDWRLRHSVRPGITGLAQISGRSAISKEDRVRLDLDWVRDPGFGRYLSILFGTLKILGGRESN